ncbi:hypothetical protein [Faecalicatena contorta]
MIRGWMNYFGKFKPSAMEGTYSVLQAEI